MVMKSLKRQRAKSESPAKSAATSPQGIRADTHIELAKYLAEYSRHGIPDLQGFEMAQIPDDAFAYILWALQEKNLNEYMDSASLPVHERARQAVIRELINTEAEHIRHLTSMLEVFIATAHSLQKREKLLNIDTEKLFSNIPDVLNASLLFWNIVLMPMIMDAVDNRKPFNTELMFNGFAHFDEILFPYEKYVVEQSNLLEYYRSKQKDPEFSMYLTWCQNRKECCRLQLNDFLVKPLQRLTKYALILQRLIDHTEGPELSALIVMEMQAKSYVTNVNYSVRQREEIDKLIKLQLTLEPYECDLKDDELERQFRLCSAINLREPMLYCQPYHSRCLIHQANLRYRDGGAKETDARVILLTDMLLICKRLSKSSRRCKIIRVKYMIDKLVQVPKFVGRNSNELSGLGYIILDDLGSSSHSFILTESPKDSDPQETLRTWENKVKEARLTYEMMIWSAQNPNREMTNAELQHMVDYLQIRARSSVDEAVIEHEARERVNAMVHESKAVPKYDPSQFSAEIATKVVVGISARPPGSHPRSHIFHRTVPKVFAKTSQMSLLKPTSIRSHSDEEQSSPSTSRLQRRTTSLEPLMIPLLSDEAGPSIKVHLSGSDGDTESSALRDTPSHQTHSRSMDSTQQQTLRVKENSQNNVGTLIYSLPDLTVEPCTPKSNSSPPQTSASQKLYRSHQELLQRNRLEASKSSQYLTPEHRGSSHPSPSPTRASLKRGLAFSSSFNKTTPTLTKMDHVGSQSPIFMDEGPSTSQQSQAIDRGSSPKPGPSSERSDKKSSSISSDRKRDLSDDRQSEPCSSRTVSPRRSRIDDPRRYGSRSASSSYKEESPATSFRDESTDLSCRDRTSTSLSHSPGTSFRDESFGHSYDKDSTSTGAKTDSSELDRKVDSLVRDQRDEHDQIDRSDRSDRSDMPLLKHRKLISHTDQPSHKILTRQDEIIRSIHIVQRQDVIKEEISTSSDKTTSPKVKPEESPECSSRHREFQYTRLRATQGDREYPGFSYSSDSSSSTPTLDAVEPIKEDSPSTSRGTVQ